MNILTSEFTLLTHFCKAASLVLFAAAMHIAFTIIILRFHHSSPGWHTTGAFLVKEESNDASNAAF